MQWTLSFLAVSLPTRVKLTGVKMILQKGTRRVEICMAPSASLVEIVRFDEDMEGLN